jgi:hypothetical protein
VGAENTPCGPNEQRRLVKERQKRLDIQRTEGGIIICENLNYRWLLVHGAAQRQYSAGPA